MRNGLHAARQHGACRHAVEIKWARHFSGKLHGRIGIRLICSQLRVTCSHQRNAAQISRTWPRSQRCAGSASSHGCQSNETVNSGVETGSGKLCISARRLPVCCSGTHRHGGRLLHSHHAADHARHRRLPRPVVFVIVGLARAVGSRAFATSRGFAK